MIEIEKTPDGWRFILADKDGEFRITSDPYPTKAAARKGFEAMIKLLPDILPGLAVPPVPDEVEEEPEE